MAARFTHIPRDRYRRALWKNGLGWTEEIAIDPPGSDLKRGDFLWRISTARVAQSATFSIFPDHDRVLVIVKGQGVRLLHTFVEGDEPEVVELPPFEPHEFPGDITTRCELIGGEIEDFSVFIRKGEASVLPEVLQIPSEGLTEWQPQGQVNLLFVAQGRVELAHPESGENIELAERDSFRIDTREEPLSNAIILRGAGGDAVVVAVQIELGG